MSSLKKLSDYEPLTTSEVIDGIELYAIVNGKTVRVSKANLFSADRDSVKKVKKELNDTINNQIKTVNTSIDNLNKKIHDNRDLEDERWAQTLMRGYNKTHVFSGSIGTDKITRSQAPTKLVGTQDIKFSAANVTLAYPKYKKVEWENNTHTRTVVNTYNSFSNDNTVILFCKWREKYNSNWTDWNYDQYRQESNVYTINSANFSGPHARFSVHSSDSGIVIQWQRWMNDTMVTEIQYRIGIMNYNYFGSNSRVDIPTVPVIDTTTTDKHSITTSNGIRW